MQRLGGRKFAILGRGRRDLRRGSALIPEGAAWVSASLPESRKIYSVRGDIVDNYGESAGHVTGEGKKA